MEKERTERKDKLLEKLEEIKNKQIELRDEIKRVEEELNGGERTNNEKQNKNIQATQEETIREEIKDTKTEILNVKAHTQELEKDQNKQRKPNKPKPTKEEAVVKKIEEVTPEESTIPDK